MIEDPVFKLTADGVKVPSYEEVYDYFKNELRSIFGEDINLDPDTADGQLLATIALSRHNANAQCAATYASFSPRTAKGLGLDSVCAQNGVVRHHATKSQADLTLIGQAGAEIINGVAIDSFNKRWVLPERVVIPTSGEITVTAIAEDAGATKAVSGSINKIGTPTLGWQRVFNKEDAIEGANEETDSALRARQARSTALPSVSIWDGIKASLLNLKGVTRVAGVKNDTGAIDNNGVPGHTVALIVDGGDAEEIAKTIYVKKGEGTGTHGDITKVYQDSYGYPNTVKFSRPKVVDIAVKVKIKPSQDYLSSVDNEIKNRIATYINSLPIGVAVNVARTLSVAVNPEDVDTRFDLLDIALARKGEVLATKSIPVLWNEAAKCSVDDIQVEVQA
jgi:uncharacterized phage protein gp47/JayE|uniref:Baseplate J like protein n=1 Tax=Myoviridae sp. ctakU3 TaxID=2825135 RepID=A0A8S5P1S5_9CAUD|nr:MAG TPA: Baseplate J like protein [Myoviridae sp. ctakU3]